MRVRHGLFLLLAGLLSVAALSGCGTPAVTTPAGEATATTGTGATRTLSSYFVSAAHVQENLARSIVLDARSAEAYQAGHIAGAVSAPWQLFAKLGSRKPGDAGYATLKSTAAIARQLGALGIDTKKQIVVYSAPGGGEDGRVVWMLRMAGIPNSMVLDGGYAAWTASGFATSTQESVLPETIVPLATLDRGLIATTDEVAAGLDALKLVDVRTAAQFTGSTDAGEPRGGHIPGAVDVPFASLFTPAGTLKAPAELIALFEAVGVGPANEIVVYSTDGVSSADVTLVLRALGYAKSRNYDGSFFEWAGDKLRSVIK